MKTRAKSIYQQLKAQNGEKFAQYLRTEHSAVLGVPNIVFLLQYAGKNADCLIDYLGGLVPKPELSGEKTDSPLALLDKAGYEATVADSLEKQNAILPYFAEKERLCTFSDEKRYLKHFIVNAVKKDVASIKREDFLFPEREDAYGTSVLSIQIDKKKGYISIKNRYNNSVDEPDNTFDNNPDKIIKGLTKALYAYFNITPSEKTQSLPAGYHLLKNGQIFYYEREMNNVYFNQKAYVANGEIHQIDKDCQILLDNLFILDLKKKEVLNPAGVKDSFPAFFTRFLKNKKVRLLPCNPQKMRLYADHKPVMDIVRGHIVWLKLPNVTRLDDYFLRYNTELRKVYAANAREMGVNCFEWNQKLKGVYMPNLIKMGENFNDNPCMLRLIKKVSARHGFYEKE